ncbi:MAG: Crp/Fnr family transcriptional regulator [Gammaproteobacteria bacterium]|nr:Crp/Fnr family transcriptional regulator [Gammaproteobacteria bacterium]
MLITSGGNTLNAQEKQLLAYLRKLSQADAHALLRFAAYLAGETPDAVQTPATSAGSDSAAAEIPEPQLAERPENERVVDALKRLRASYPMLDTKKLLDKASTLVAQHVMFAKPAKDVIDEVEKLFAEAYDTFVRERRGR